MAQHTTPTSFDTADLAGIGVDNLVETSLEEGSKATVGPGGCYVEGMSHKRAPVLGNHAEALIKHFSSFQPLFFLGEEPLRNHSGQVRSLEGRKRIQVDVEGNHYHRTSI